MQRSTRFHSGDESRRRAGQTLKRRIAAFSAATILAIGAIVAEAVLSEREAAIDRAGAEAANLAAEFEERIRSTLDAAPDLKRRIEATEPTFSLEEWTSVARDLLDRQQEVFLREAAAIDLTRSDGVRLARYTAAGGLDTAARWTCPRRTSVLRKQARMELIPRMTPPMGSRAFTGGEKSLITL